MRCLSAVIKQKLIFTAIAVLSGDPVFLPTDITLSYCSATDTNASDEQMIQTYLDSTE